MKNVQITSKEINRLAFPAIMAGIAEPLISLVDTAVVGKLGTEEQGAVGIAAAFFSLVVWVLGQLKSAISAIVARNYGQQSLKRIQYFVAQSVWLCIVIGVTVAGLSMVFSNQIFGLYNAEGELLEHAVSYFSIRSLGFPLTLATFAIFGIFRGLQNTAWAMLISIVGGLVNAVLDLTLVFGVDGFLPAMGIQGVALASLAAQVVMFTMTVIYLFVKTPFNLNPGTRLHPSISELGVMTANLVVRTLALNTAYFLAARFSTSYGPKYIAAHSIVMNIWLFSSFFLDGFANAGNAIAGKILGQRNLELLYAFGIRINKINVTIGFALAGLYVLAYPFIGPFFNPDEMVVIEFNAVFWLLILSQPINAMAFTFDGIYKGLGKTSMLRNTLLIATFVGFVPSLYLFDLLDMKLTGVWIAFTIFMAFRSGLLTFDFIKSYKPDKATSKS